ncbi:hypothetical protein L2E82_51636 [Cichorium intybus]|nr:hypothetical protein L2E82_51636 [Cichorium intybus]
MTCPSYESFRLAPNHAMAENYNGFTEIGTQLDEITEIERQLDGITDAEKLAKIASTSKKLKDNYIEFIHVFDRSLMSSWRGSQFQWQVQESITI